jgi:hypothetical protein
MTSDASPTLEYYKDGLPPEMHDDKASRKRRKIWTIAAILVLLILGLALINFMQSDTASVLAGKGTVTGLVLDRSSLPLSAEIFIIGAKTESKTNSEGYFEIENVPAGMQSVVIAHNGSGEEIRVEVIAGSAVDLGTVRLAATALPD